LQQSIIDLGVAFKNFFSSLKGQRKGQQVNPPRFKKKDNRHFLHKLSTRVVRENQAIALEDLNVSGMVKNRSLSRVISQAGWREFRVMCEAKSSKFNREFQWLLVGQVGSLGARSGVPELWQFPRPGYQCSQEY
jgi:IS605 OrfB family transposase